MVTTPQALACTWIFLNRFEDNLNGSNIMKKIHVQVKATGDIEAQSCSKIHIFVISSYDF